MRLVMTREFYVPKGAIKFTCKAASAIAYVYEARGLYGALGFVGKANKPLFHYTYRNSALREKKIQEFFANVTANEAYKAQAKQKRKETGPGLEAGDILVSSWGYEQTNVDYYQVIERSGVMVTVRPIGRASQTTGRDSGTCVPVRDEFTGPSMRKRAHDGYVTIDRHSAHKWDGKPDHWTSYY